MLTTKAAIDFIAALVTVAFVCSVLLVYRISRRRGRAGSSARVADMGSSAVVGRGAMDAWYFNMSAIAGRLVSLGVSANAITWTSLGFGLGGGVALAFGMPGVASVLIVAAGICDLLDGLVARAAGTSSSAGEVLDAAIDRYGDEAVFAGVAIAWRGNVWLLVLALAAAIAAGMVTLSTAKAEALGIKIGGAIMRRHERVGLLVAGCVCSAVSTPLFVRFDISTDWAIAPLAVAVGLIALLGNSAAVRRFIAIARGARAAEQAAAAVASAGAELERPGIGLLVGEGRAPVE